MHVGARAAERGVRRTCDTRARARIRTGMHVHVRRYHIGAPVFHEGIKSWSCCSAATFLEFDAFMAHPGASRRTARARRYHIMLPRLRSQRSLHIVFFALGAGCRVHVGTA